MSRTKLGRSVIDTCADCGVLDPTWASINKGILICDECCSIHRTLGRHISHVKSLRKGTWVPSQLAMVHALHSNGANSIWEHSLLDPTNSKSGRRKPQPKDPVKPTKADFIRTKHQLLGFVYRGSRADDKDSQDSADGDVSKQLHSSVRTANLETSLRLLSCGADPNFLHPEKRTCPLHVAAAAGQASQVELLLVYGADPGAVDLFGKNPGDCAREAGYSDIAYRLLECQYELTDRISFYLCERKPDHGSGQHFLIPEMSDSIDGSSEVAKAAKKKLQMLSNYLFEEMAMDVYDEVDRRETENFWLSLQGPSLLVADRGSVPFLPVNSEFSATRNQARQKLGRLNAREFATLLIDLLCEAKRRQMGGIASLISDGRLLHGLRESYIGVSDDEPLYDSVASEEELMQSEQQHMLVEQNREIVRQRHQDAANTVSVEAYLDIKEQLSLSNNRMQQLLKSNNTMQDQIGVLQSMVQTLMQENNHLKTSSAASSSHASPVHSNGSALLSAAPLSLPPPPLPPPPCRNVQDPATEPVIVAPMRGAKSNAGCRPFSMFEPREGPGGSAAVAAAGRTTVAPSHSAHSALAATRSTPHKQSNAATSEQVIRLTNMITKRIQEVFRTVQDQHQNQVEPYAKRIVDAVQSLTLIFDEGCSDQVKCYLQQLTASASRMLQECHAVSQESVHTSLDHNVASQRIIQGAYDVAKATKNIVTLFQ